MKKLNLGCGEFKKDGYINIDISDRSHPEIIHDLEEIPYPFDEHTFDLIEADHVLEHLNDPFQVMKELHRILKPHGRMIIKVPHFSRGMTHPQHKRGFDVTFPNYFDEKFVGGFTGTPLKCEKLRLHWFAQKHLMKRILSPITYYILSGMGKFIDLLAQISPLFCSRIWCYYVGGFYEIMFVFRKL